MAIVLIIVGLVVLGGLIYILIRNGIIASRNRVDEAWSGIDVQLKRRHDLVPNLVESVKGYATHERETFEKVTQARAAAMGARASSETAQAECALTAALGGLPRRRRAVPRAARHRELPAAPAPALRARGRDPGLAPDLQLERPVLQHEDPAVPDSIVANQGNFTDRVLRDRGRRRARLPRSRSAQANRFSELVGGRGWSANAARFGVRRPSPPARSCFQWRALLRSVFLLFLTGETNWSPI